MRRFLSLVLLILCPSPAVAQRSIQEALLRAKPAVVLVVAEVGAEVTLGCGAAGERRVTPPPFRETGTGWFIDAGGWVITNAHVVATVSRPSPQLTPDQLEKAVRAECVPALVAGRGLRPGERPDVEQLLTRQILAAAASTATVKVEPTITVLLSNGVRFPATVVKYSPPVAGETMSGRDLALLRVEAADMPSLSLADSSAARIGDPLHILGFPGVVLSHELLNASAKLEASVTMGAISGFKQDVSGQPVIQTDAPAAWGNSGGPAVDVNGRVVGVLTFVTLEPSGTGVVQGFNFVIPSAAVREFLADTSVPLNGMSKFNNAWHTGLAEFFAGKNTTAARYLQEANRLLPELPDVRRITAENEERIKHPAPRPFPWAAIAIAVIVVSGLAFGCLGLRQWKRNRFRIRPAEVARLLETSSDPPIILDVRNDDAYAKSPVQLPRARHLAARDLAEGAPTISAAERARMVVAYCT